MSLRFRKVLLYPRLEQGIVLDAPGLRRQHRHRLLLEPMSIPEPVCNVVLRVCHHILL